MLLGLWISVLFRHAKIDHMDDISRLAVRPADEKIIWLDITVDEIFFVDCLDSGQLTQIS